MVSGGESGPVRSALPFMTLRYANLRLSRLDVRPRAIRTRRQRSESSREMDPATAEASLLSEGLRVTRDATGTLVGGRRSSVSGGVELFHEAFTIAPDPDGFFAAVGGSGQLVRDAIVPTLRDAVAFVLGAYRHDVEPEP